MSGIAFARAPLLVAPFLFLFALAAGAESRDATAHFFDQNFGNLKEEVEAAQKDGKRGLLIMFEQADCPWCSKMMATVLNQVPVQDYYKRHFRAIQIDIKGDNSLVDFDGRETTEKGFAFTQRARATPVFAFFGTDGKLLTKYTGATKDPQEFLWLGEFVVDDHYKNKTFTAYKRERMASKK